MTNIRAQYRDTSVVDIPIYFVKVVCALPLTDALLSTHRLYHYPCPPTVFVDFVLFFRKFLLTFGAQRCCLSLVCCWAICFRTAVDDRRGRTLTSKITARRPKHRARLTAVDLACATNVVVIRRPPQTASRPPTVDQPSCPSIAPCPDDNTVVLQFYTVRLITIATIL